jgi:ABC-type Fe3+/spermidine/putrescine transport system ATPase subunit
VAFGLKREGLPKDEVQRRTGEMLDLVQLGQFAKRKPHQLSGGQQQRVALARSLAKKPKLLLLDEPLGALDKKLREQTQFELVNIIEKVGVTCVMVTHDQEEAMTMANRIAVMSKGRVLQVGTPQEIYEYPPTVLWPTSLATSTCWKASSASTRRTTVRHWHRHWRGACGLWHQRCSGHERGRGGAP